MNIPTPSKSRLREKGAALIVTLLVVVLLATITAGFIAATRIEQMASRNFTYQNVAEQMALLATEQAIAQLNRDVGGAITATGSAITMPGAAVFNGSLIQLSSASAPGATGTSTNLNQFGTIHTNTNISFSVPLVAVSNNLGAGNPVYGRFAYWIDDDGSKANLNLLGAATARANYLPTNNIGRELLDTSVLPSGSTLASGISSTLGNTNATDPWSYFFTPRQLLTLNRIGTDRAGELYPLVSAGPINLSNSWYLTNTLFRGSRINLNQSQSTNIVSNVRYGVNFIQNPSANSALTTELNNLITNRIDRPAVTNRFGASFQSKYGMDVLRQILVNVNDLNLATGVNANPGNTATTGSGYTNSEGIPLAFSGLRRFIHLNEIACKAAYSTNSPCGSAVEFQMWFAVELVNPYRDAWGDAAQLTFGITDFSANVSYQLNGNNFSTNFPPPGIPPPPPQTSGTNGISLFESVLATNYADSSGGRRMTFAFEYQAWKNVVGWGIPGAASNVTVPRMSFRPTYVKLLQWANSNSTIRDWAISSDFSQHGPGGLLTFSNIPLVTGGIKTNGAAAPNYLATPANNISNFNIGSLGIAKNDPRVRTFPSWSFSPQAWSWVGGSSPNAVTIGGNNTGTVNFSASTGRPNVPNDRTSASATNIFAHESFSNAFRAGLDSIPYLSVMELGKVHTGLQWRTLQMLSQNATESDAGLIPDWALLDSFYLSNNVPKMNVNSIHYPVIESSTIAAMATNGLLRSRALQTLLSAGTNSAAATNVFFPSNSAMSASGTNSFAAISSNISRLGFTTTWSNRRTDLGATNFPTNAFASTGELLEITSVANFGTSDTVNEGRAASFIDAVSTFSDVFSIYATGYAVDRTGATVSEFTTRTQVQWDPSTSRFRPVFTEPLRAQ